MYGPASSGFGRNILFDHAFNSYNIPYGFHQNLIVYADEPFQYSKSSTKFENNRGLIIGLDAIGIRSGNVVDFEGDGNWRQYRFGDEGDEFGKYATFRTSASARSILNNDFEMAVLTGNTIRIYDNYFPVSNRTTITPDTSTNLKALEWNYIKGQASGDFKYMYATLAAGDAEISMTQHADGHYTLGIFPFNTNSITVVLSINIVNAYPQESAHSSGGSYRFNSITASSSFEIPRLSFEIDSLFTDYPNTGKFSLTGDYIPGSVSGTITSTDGQASTLSISDNLYFTITGNAASANNNYMRVSVESLDRQSYNSAGINFIFDLKKIKDPSISIGSYNTENPYFWYFSALVDGDLKNISLQSNVALTNATYTKVDSFTHRWDIRTDTLGEHELYLEGQDYRGNTIRSSSFRIDNSTVSIGEIHGTIPTPFRHTYFSEFFGPNPYYVFETENRAMTVSDNIGTEFPYADYAGAADGFEITGQNFSGSEVFNVTDNSTGRQYQIEQFQIEHGLSLSVASFYKLQESTSSNTSYYIHY